MNADVLQDVNMYVEGGVSSNMDELEERLSELLSGCAMEKYVRDESDALKVLLAGVKRRFREGHAALVMATNKQRPLKNAQMTLLEALSREVRMVHEKMDGLCSRTGRLGHILGDVASIAKTVQAVEKNAETVSSSYRVFRSVLTTSGLSLGTKPTRS